MSEYGEQREATSRPSVKLIRGASGSTSVEVKVYADDIETAKAEARRVYDDLCRVYQAPAPRASRA